MKIAGLVDVLNLFTGIPFTEWAWSEAPADGYGVVTADGQSEFRADADPVAEKMLTGYVDVFVKATDPDPTEDVEDAMRALGVWFSIESIQFEPETGFLHFEWRWRDVLTSAKETLEGLPLLLHITKTEDVIGADEKTYRKITFAEGETDKIWKYKDSRDMIVYLQGWGGLEEYDMKVVLRKLSTESIEGITVVRLGTTVFPGRPIDPEKERTIGYTEAYEIGVYYNNGVFYRAFATKYTSA